MTPETLKKYGYRRIASEAHAAQLLRRELKHHARWQQHDYSLGTRHDRSFRRLLEFRAGNWYKFLGSQRNGYCSTIIWIIGKEG